MSMDEVLIVGAGISGVAAARSLQDRGVPVRVVERARVAGGRMASRTWGDRRVDLGASYFTAEPGSAFDAVVQDWLARGLAREWTDTFAVAGPEGIRETKTGPLRYAAAAGLRSLVEDLGAGLGIRQETTVDEVAAEGVTVLAMPDPQALRLLPTDAAARPRLDGPEAWEPTIAVALRFEDRCWPADLHGAFVNDSDALGFVADDGDRRGDGAPVLVAHSTAALARDHLDDPDAAVPAIRDATVAALGLAVAPVDAYAHRWTFARPARPHEAPYLFDADAGLGVCGDGWGGRSSVGAAWTSGHELGLRIADAVR